MLKAFDFAKIVSRKKIEGSGLKVGETVLIVSLQQLPEKKSDPYLTRTYVRVLKMEGGKPLTPREDNDYKVYLMDPRSLEKIEGDILEDLRKSVEEHYSNASS